MALTRIQQLAHALQETGNDVFVAQTATSLGYLQNFAEDGHERFLASFINKDGEAELVCPALSREQAIRAGVGSVHAWRDGEDPIALVRAILEKWGATAGRFAVDDHLPASMLLTMQHHFPDARFVAGGDLLARLMSRKDDSELGYMKQAGQIADEAFEEVAAVLATGMSEKQVAAMLFKAMERRGGVPIFASVARGEYAAEPHHLNSDEHILENDVVVMDFGCTVSGYFSDITRSVCVGQPTDEQRKVYETVYNAHMAAMAAVKPGVPAADVDAAARGVIDSLGYGEFFTHRTGHGIGAHIHEAPYIVSTNTVPLEIGNCFSIEPGIYLPGRFGIRIENIVHCGPESAISFNAAPDSQIRCL